MLHTGNLFDSYSSTTARQNGSCPQCEHFDQDCNPDPQTWTRACKYFAERETEADLDGQELDRLAYN